MMNMSTITSIRTGLFLLGTAAALTLHAQGKFSGGPGSGAAMASASGSLGGVAVSLSSASNQVLPRTAAAVPAAAITVTSTSAGGLSAAGDIRITIPDGNPMQWLPSTPVLGGSGSGKVGASATVENDGRTAVLDVTADFGAGESVTIDGLSFTNLVAASLPSLLALDVDADGKADTFDAMTVAVRMPRPGGAGDGYAMVASVGDVSLYASGGTLIWIR